MIQQTAKEQAMTPSVEESPTKVPTFLLPLLLLCGLSGACHPKDRTDGSVTDIQTVLPATSDIAGDPGGNRKLEAACQAWTLEPAQAALFFNLAREYPEGQRRTFDWLPCSIKGTLVAEGKNWQFETNAASTATWTHQQKHRYWGCSDPGCEALVLLMPNSNRP